MTTPHRRRAQRAQKELPPDRRWRVAILLAGAAAVVAYACRTGDVEPSSRRSAVSQAPVKETYQLLERSWADLPAAEAEEDEDPEAVRWLAARAEQWQNMDISVQGDR